MYKRQIYEDNILGKLSDSRYATLDAQYEKEQSELTVEISDLEKAIKSYETVSYTHLDVYKRQIRRFVSYRK